MTDHWTPTPEDRELWQRAGVASEKDYQLSLVVAWSIVLAGAVLLWCAVTG